MIGGGTQTINVADTTDGNLIIDKTGGIVFLDRDLVLDGTNQSLVVENGWLNTRTFAIEADTVRLQSGGRLSADGDINGDLTLESGSILAMYVTDVQFGIVTQRDVSAR